MKKYLVFLVPAAVILAFLSIKLFTLSTGTAIELEVPRPIDPVDLLRGNYVELGYTISQPEIEWDLEEGDHVYVVLRKGDQFWEPERYTRNKPELAAYEVCLGGTATSSRRVSWDIEHFFAPTDKAKEIEDARWDETVSAIVYVDSFCNGVLRALNVDGERIQTS